MSHHLMKMENEFILSEKSMRGYEEIYKAESIGAFVISKEAAQTLTELRKRLDDEDSNPSWVENMFNSLSAVNKGLEEFRDHAKRDLNI